MPRGTTTHENVTQRLKNFGRRLCPPKPDFPERGFVYCLRNVSCPLSLPRVHEPVIV